MKFQQSLFHVYRINFKTNPFSEDIVRYLCVIIVQVGFVEFYDQLMLNFMF